MKFNFKKIASVLASAVMLTSTLGVGLAANYPQPMVSEDGAAQGAIVVGADAPSNLAGATDIAAANDLKSALNDQVTATGEVTIGEDSWQVATSSDDLELGESIADVTSYVDGDDLNLLTSESISNAKGTAEYDQYLYFGDTTSSRVTYQEDDEDNVGLMFKIASGETIANYTASFTSYLKSDIDTANSNDLDDITDETMTLLGQEYTVTSSSNSSGGKLTLMTGAAKTTLDSGEEVNVGGHTVSVTVVDSSDVDVTIDGSTITGMADGDIEPIPGSTDEYVALTDSNYQAYSGGLSQATLYVGANKLVLKNGAALEVNGESISDATVSITSSQSGGDISISEISINMVAEDGLYVASDEKLSDADNLAEPAVLFGQNWDIVYKGLADYEKEELTLTSSNSDRQYNLKFTNYDGDVIDLPLVYSTSGGIFGGDRQTDHSELLRLNASGDITEKDYFVLNSKDPATAGNDARSYGVQYTSSTKQTSSDPAEVSLDILGQGKNTYTMKNDDTFDVTLGGTTFTFSNVSSMGSNDFNISLDGTANGYSTGLANDSGNAEYYGALQMRSGNNALITVNDTAINGTVSSSDDWTVDVTLDDGDRDGDDVSLDSGATQTVFNLTLSNSSGEVSSSSFNVEGSAITDPDNSDKSLFQSTYGAYVENLDTSDAPAQITAEIPESVVNPEVYVTSEAVTSGAGQVTIVKDNEVSSVSDKNLVVVGGSCVNTVAADILGVDYKTCGSDFTAETDVDGSDTAQYIIKAVASPENEDKVAVLAAGYSAADTKNAVDKLMEDHATDVGTEEVYPQTQA